MKEAWVYVEAAAGDLILFDSRTFHGSEPAFPGLTPPQTDTPELLRAVVPVCMVPRECATAEALAWRREVFEFGQTTKHSPHLQQNHSAPKTEGYTPPQLSDEMRRVL